MNRRLILSTFAASLASMVTVPGNARPLHFLLEKKVKAYRAKLQAWAQSPEIMALARQHQHKSDPALVGADWRSPGLAPAIAAMLNNEISRELSKLTRDRSVAKLLLLNDMGDVLGATQKPRYYNYGESLAFTEAIYSGVWAANRSNVDPTLRKRVVEMSAPIIDRNREIGVLYLQLYAD